MSTRTQKMHLYGAYLRHWRMQHDAGPATKDVAIAKT